MEPIREPRSTEQAAALLEQWADLDGQIATIEADRTAGIADVNARCDRASADLVKRRDAAASKLAAWWGKAGEKLTEGKRKSIELGGCEIGSRAGSASLAFEGDERAVCKKLLKLRWAKALLRVTLAFDKKAVLKALEGKRKTELEACGFGRNDPADTFVLKRVQQGGTLGGN